MATTTSDGSVELLKLHQNPQYIRSCCALLNQQWPRSETARLVLLERSNDSFPISWLLMQQPANQLIGYASTAIQAGTNGGERRRTVFVSSVVVAREKRGQGFGSRLMALLERNLKEMNFQRVELHTIDKQSFYARLGYRTATIDQTDDRKNPITSNPIDLSAPNAPFVLPPPAPNFTKSPSPCVQKKIWMFKNLDDKSL